MDISMACERCKQGLMHAAKFWDLKTSGVGFYQFTCMNCGEVVDEVILKNRQLKELPPPIKTRSFRKMKNKKVGEYAVKDFNRSTPPIRMEHR